MMLVRLMQGLTGAQIRSNEIELFSGSGRRGWSVGAGNQGQSPANRGFRSQAGCQRRQRRTKAGYGHPEATLKLPLGSLVANR
jgi:hypothetical protein